MWKIRQSCNHRAYNEILKNRDLHQNLCLAFALIPIVGKNGLKDYPTTQPMKTVKKYEHKNLRGNSKTGEKPRASKEKRFHYMKNCYNHIDQSLKPTAPTQYTEINRSYTMKLRPRLIFYT